jgi:hypothetical protein
MRNGSYEISKFAVPEIPKVYHGAKTHFPSRAVVLEWDILCSKLAST